MALLPSFCFSAAFLFELVSMLGALKCFFCLCAFGLSAPTSPSLEISMAISIGAKCYYLLVFIRSH